MSTLVPRLSEIEAATVAAKEPNAVALAEAFASQQTPEDDRWKLLIQVFQMMLRAGNAGEPFEPILRTSDGRRSMIPLDLTAGDLEALRSVFPGPDCAAYRARLGDVLWLRERNPAAGKLAVDAYRMAGLAIERSPHPSELTSTTNELLDLQGRSTKRERSHNRY